MGLGAQAAFLRALYIHLIIRLEAAIAGERAINQLLKEAP